MKYYVIHSGKDIEEVKRLMTKWSDAYENVQFVILEGNQTNWEGDAMARIRECGKVLYLVGEASAGSPYIQIELDIARKEAKDIYVYKLKASNKVNDCLMKTHKDQNLLQGEYEGEIIIGKAKEQVFLLSDDELKHRMEDDSQEVEKILKGGNYSDKEILMEQYKMFVQTSEDLVSRKQTVNTFYVTLNSILLGAIVSIVCAVGDIMTVAGDNFVIYIIAAFLSVIGVVICCSWMTLLTSYSDLNASKMAIINCIEERLALKLFDTEWALLTRRIGNKKYRSFTVKELAVAKIFVALYVLIMIAAIVLIIL